MPPITISYVLCLIALIIFALATFGVGFAGLNMVAMGLAFLAAARLVP